MNAVPPRDAAALPPEGAARPLATLLGTRTGAADAAPLLVAHALSVEHVRAFAAVAGRLPDTPLVAAWALLLARWSGQSTAAWAELSGRAAAASAVVDGTASEFLAAVDAARRGAAASGIECEWA